jgi:excisionase family DNA binding protein
MKITLGQAARLTGTSKTTITRAIKAGRLSATRRDDGGYEIDVAELERVYEIKPVTPATGDAKGDVVHHATPGAAAPATPTTPDVEMIARVAAMEAELRGLKDMVSELRQARDGWQAQAERVTLALPSPERHSWWKRLAG